MKNKWVVWLIVGLLAVSVLVTVAIIAVTVFFVTAVNEVSNTISSVKAPADRVDLSGDWKFTVDPSKVGDANGYYKVDFDDNSWQNISILGGEELPREIIKKSFEVYQADKKTLYSGYVWYRKTVLIPAEWAGKPVFLNLGNVVDMVDTYINGCPSGGGSAPGGYVSLGPCEDIIQFGKLNVIVVRVECAGGTVGAMEGYISLTSDQPENYNSTKIDLSGEWKFAVDSSRIGDTKGYNEADYDDNLWQTINVPGSWGAQSNSNVKKPFSGFVWYRKTISIPADWSGKDLHLNVGKVAETGRIYVNGQRSGDATDGGYVSFGMSSALGKARPGKLNVIAIRVEDSTGGAGGLVEGPISITTDKSENYMAVSGTIGAEVSASGRDVIIERWQRVSEVNVALGDVTVKGHVTGDVNVVKGNIIVEQGGIVDGDVHTVFGNVVVKSGGAVSGDVSFIAGSSIFEQGSIRRGVIEQAKHGSLGIATSPNIWTFVQIIFAALLAMLAVALFPKRMEKVADTAFRRPGLSALYGIAALLLVVPVAVMLAITIIGIPLVVVEVVLAVFAWFVGGIAIELAVGRKMGVHRPVIAAGLGAIILGLAGLFPIPGWPIVFVLNLLGAGAVWITGFGGYDNWWVHRFGKKTEPQAESKTPTK